MLVPVSPACMVLYCRFKGEFSNSWVNFKSPILITRVLGSFYKSPISFPFGIIILGDLTTTLTCTAFFFTSITDAVLAASWRFISATINCPLLTSFTDKSKVMALFSSMTNWF